MQSLATVFILVGGAQSKLPARLNDVPPPLIPLGDRPLLDHILEKMKAEGFSQVVLLAGHQGDLFQMYEARGDEFGLEIITSIEPQPLGTAGALAYAVDQMKARGLSIPPAFLIIKGDRWITGSLAPLRKTEPTEQPPLTLVNVGGQSSDDFLLLHSSILSSIPRGQVCQFKKEILSRYSRVQSVPLEGRILDLGTAEGYAELCMDRAFARVQKEAAWAIPLLGSWLHHGTIVTSSDDLLTALIQSGFDNVSLAPELNNHTVQGLTERDVCIDAFTSPEVPAALSAASAAALIQVTSQTQSVPAGLLDSSVTSDDCARGLLFLNDLMQELSDVRWYYSKQPDHSHPCLFLDRDGTMIEHVHYLSKPEDVRLRPAIIPLIQAAHAKNWGVICVTNQSGLGRHHFSWDDYMRVQKRMNELLAAQGVFLDASMEAPYFHDSPSARWQCSQSLRKPRGGLLQMTARRWGYDIRKSVMVGDSLVDLQAGAVAGVKTVVCVGKDDKVVREYESWASKWPGHRPTVLFDSNIANPEKILG